MINVSANQTQPLKRKAEASNETSALIIRAIYLYFTTGYYTSLPTAVTLLYSQLLYLTVSLLTVWWKCHAPRHYRFKLCFSWIRTPLGQDSQQIKQIPVHVEFVSLSCFDDAHNCRTCSGSFFRVAKKEILSVDDIRLHRSFCPYLSFLHRDCQGTGTAFSFVSAEYCLFV